MSYYVFKNSGFKREAFKFAIFYVLKVVCTKINLGWKGLKPVFLNT